MGKVSFPLHNVRKDVLNNWHLAEITEEIVVPSQADENGFYTVSLTEIPDSSPSNPVTIEGLTEYRGNPYDEKSGKFSLGIDQFFVNYGNGTVLFNSEQADADFTVVYWGKGSLVEADDVNDLNDRVESARSSISAIQTSVEEMQSSVSAAVSAANEATAAISGITEEVSGMSSTVSGMQDALNSKANSSDVEALSATVGTNSGNILSLQSALETANENVSGVSTRVETLENAGYITSSALEGLATESFVEEKVGEIQVPDVSGFITADALEPYATKQELPDVSSFITAEALEPYATKQELPDVSSFATESFVTEKIGEIQIPDVSGFITVDALEPYATKQELPDVSSFITASALEPYATKQELPDVSDYVTAEDVSTAISASGHVSESQLNGAVDGVNAQLEANYESAVSRLANLERQMEKLSRTNLEPVTSTSNASFNDSSADLVLSAGDAVTENSAIVANTVEIKSLNVESSMVSMTSNGVVSVSNFESQGDYPKSRGNAQVIVTTSDYVEFKDSTFGTTGYNCIEIGLNANSVPKGVLVENCNFTSTLSNNAIIVFAHQDDAVIHVKNCNFGNLSNVLRISNRSNKKGTFIFENCTFAGFDSYLAYTGAVICQDYTSGTTEQEVEANLFAPEKIKIKFINCTGPDGSKIAGDPDPSIYSGSGTDKQLIYVYGDRGGIVAYDAARYPRVVFE